MDRPWMKFFTRDWLDNKELRSCSEVARSVLADLMCLAHEGYPYGYLASSLGPLKEDYLAARCFTHLGKFRKALIELKSASRIEEEAGILFIRRMVEDEDLRLRRAAGGSKGGNPGIPRKVNLEVNLGASVHSRARIRADSDSDSEHKKQKLPLAEAQPKPSWEKVNETWKWVKAEFPGDVNDFSEMQLFISVMESDEDLDLIRINLPLWKRTQRWIDGYFPSFKNFLSERQFRITPKSKQTQNGYVYTPPANLVTQESLARELAEKKRKNAEIEARNGDH